MRFPTSIPAVLTVGPRTMAATIVDLSERGAQVRLADRLEVGCTVRLAAQELDVAGMVVRSTADGYGIELTARIRPLHVVRANLWHRPATA